MTYTDWLGQSIEVGSPVLYAISNSHYAQVVWGEVMDVIPAKSSTRPIWVTKNGRREKIGDETYYPYGRTFKLKIQPHYQSSLSSPGERGTDYHWDTEDGKWAEGASLKYVRMLPKPVFIQNVEKVTVFPLPDGVRENFERIIEEKISANNKRQQERKND